MAHHRKSSNVARAIFLCLTGVFLLLGSREPPWGDAAIMYEVGDGIATHGTFAIHTEWPPMSHRGVGDLIFSQYALGPSVISIPGVWLRQILTAVFPSSGHLVLVVTAHLAHAMLAALVCVLFFRLARRCGASSKVASLGTIILAFATMIFVYARSPFSEILQTAAAIGLAGALIEILDAPTRRNALVFGVWAGVLFNAKAIFALSILGAAVLLVFRFWRDRTALRSVALWSAASFAPLGAIALAYNHLRWGSPFDTGYGATLAVMRENVLSGLWGLLFSPGKSLFLFSPPLVLGVIAFPRFAREHRWLALAIGAIVAPPLYFYAHFVSWGGDYCWGPRYLLFAVPLLWLPAVTSLFPRLRARARAGRWACAAIVASGITVQVLGASFYWDKWIRIAIHAREAWLGPADRRGALLPINGAGLCDGCFEDNHGHDWLPPFSPILGHAWLLRHLGDPWPVALRDAPWRRYTSIDMPGVETYYAGAQLDWWGLAWLSENGHSRPLGGALFGLFVAASWTGAMRWRRSLIEPGKPG